MKNDSNFDVKNESKIDSKVSEKSDKNVGENGTPHDGEKSPIVTPVYVVNDGRDNEIDAGASYEAECPVCRSILHFSDRQYHVRLNVFAVSGSW